MGLLLPTLYFALPPLIFPATAVTALVLVATCTDLKEGIIPDAVVLPALGMGILYFGPFPPIPYGKVLPEPYWGRGC